MTLGLKRLWLPSLILLALSHLPTASSVERADCSWMETTDDPPGDADTLVGQPYDAPPADILLATLSANESHLKATMTLAERPPNNPNEAYRYWIGFYFAPANSTKLQYVDFRVWASTAYDSAAFVGSNEAHNPRLGIYPLTWNGSTMQVSVPASDLHDYFGANATFATPIGGADGVFRTTRFESPAVAVPYVIDTTKDTSEKATPRPLPRCSAETKFATLPRSVPGVSGVDIVLFVAAVAGARQRA